jgi:hypothetical protein
VNEAPHFPSHVYYIEGFESANRAERRPMAGPGERSPVFPDLSPHFNTLIDPP